MKDCLLAMMILGGTNNTRYGTGFAMALNTYPQNTDELLSLMNLYCRGMKKNGFPILKNVGEQEVTFPQDSKEEDKKPVAKPSVKGNEVGKRQVHTFIEGEVIGSGTARISPRLNSCMTKISWMREEKLTTRITFSHRSG